MDHHYRLVLAVVLAAVASCSARQVEEPDRDAVVLVITPHILKEDGETRVLLETQVVETTGGSVIEAPSVVTKLNDDAVIETWDDDGNGLELCLTPTLRDDGVLALKVHFEQRRQGRVVRRADRDELRVAPGKSLIVPTTDQPDR